MRIGLMYLLRLRPRWKRLLFIMNVCDLSLGGGLRFHLLGWSGIGVSLRCMMLPLKRPGWRFIGILLNIGSSMRWLRSLSISKMLFGSGGSGMSLPLRGLLGLSKGLVAPVGRLIFGRCWMWFCFRSFGMCGLCC